MVSVTVSVRVRAVGKVRTVTVGVMGTTVSISVLGRGESRGYD